MCRHHISEADEQSHGPEIPTQDDARPSGEALPATLVQSQSSYLVIYCFHVFDDEPIEKNNDLSTSSPSNVRCSLSRSRFYYNKVF